MSSDHLLIDLKKQVEHQRIPKALWLCLNYTKKHQKDISKVGAAWVDNDKFILNTLIFSNFINRKIHTINRNLREHDFETKKIRQVERNFFFSKLNINSPFERSWCLRNHKDFTCSSDERIIDQIPYKQIPKKSKKKKATLQLPNISISSSKKFIDPSSLNNFQNPDNDSESNCSQIHLFNNFEDFDEDDGFDQFFSEDDQYFL